MADKKKKDPQTEPEETKRQQEAEAPQKPETQTEETPAQEPQVQVDVEALVAAEKDKYLRLAAEYDNFRKRSQKEREALYADIRCDTVAKLLPVYDNLERALNTPCGDEAFYKGVEMTMTQLKGIFETMGITPIEAVGAPFDPSVHNAVMHVDDPEQGESVVVEEFQKGFMLGDRVIRFSMVKVAN